MKLLTFYKLNDEEKNALKEESPLEKEVKLLSQKNADLELQLKILNGKKRTVEDKAEKLEKENQSLRCDISRYDVNNSSLHVRIDKMKNEIESLESKYEILKKENGSLISECEVLRKENESLKYNISQYSVNNSAMHSRIDRMKNEIENLKTENELLKSGTKRDNAQQRNFREERNLIKVGDTAKLGGYNWTVIEIEQKRILLLCNESVITSIFQSSIPFSTANWKNSTIRKWLNAEFFNTFSSSEKEKIIVTSNENVDDKIFLLSKSDFIRTRKNIFNINKEWWLRPSGTGFIEYYSVNNSLNIKIDIDKSDEKAVRPALYIKNDF